MPASSREWAEGRIAAVHTLIASYQEDMDGALHYCQLALQKISGTQRNDFHWRGTLLVLLSSLNLWKGDLEAARQNLLDAIQAETQAQDAYGFLDATTHLAQVLWMQGRLQEAVKFCEEGLQYIEQHGLGCTPAAGLLFLGWGFILCERYELDEAEKYIRRGLELNRGTSNALTMIWADQIWMRLLASRNDLLAADAVAQDASQLEKEAKIPWWFEKDFSAVKVWVWIRQGRLDEAEQYLRQQGITTDGKIQHPNQGEYHALIYLLLVRGDLAAAKTQGERFLAWAQAERQFGWVIACRVLLALIFREGGNRQQALQSLAYALELAETEDYAQVFLDKGDTIVDLLYEAVQKGIHPEYASRLMALYHRDHPEPAAGKYNRPRQPGLVAPVSEREIEVLRLLVEGLTNKEIALKLCISVRTVKYHTTSIFTKLNVNNRTQAVSKVKELGIC